MTERQVSARGGPDGEATRDDRHAFPLLTQEQIERVYPFGDEETHSEGDLLHTGRALC